MDLDEWELLPSDAFVDLHQDGGKNKIIISPSSNQKNSVIDMNYFQKLIDPPQKSVPVVVPIQEIGGKIPVVEKEIPEDDQTTLKEKIDSPKGLEVNGGFDQETVSQVFFKKLKENEFADMKMDSPKSQNMGLLPQIGVGSYQFEEKEKKKDGNFDEEEKEVEEIKPIKREKGSSKEEEIVDWEDDNNGGLNIWKWAMTGIGAVFSFGFAAATVSLIVLGNRHKEQNHHKSPELSFQFYAHEKRIKQVVDHAKKLNEAITAARGGAPLTRAHITIGGYYEGL